MLAPHSLALAGNLAAHLGVWQPVCLALIGSLFFINATTMGRRAGAQLNRSPASHLVNGNFTNHAALVLLLSGRLVTALIGAAILAVSSGFLFNEIFVYWFPNFAFAYLMLAVVAAIQVSGSKAVERAQVIFTGTAVVGLAVLVFIGMVRAPEVATLHAGWNQYLELKSIVMVMYLFVGFDLILLSPVAQTATTGRKFALMVTGFVVAILILGLWSLVSVRHVEISRLKETTVPHIVAAMNLAGPLGVKIIGVVSIAGALAGINALLRTLSVVAADLWRGIGHRPHQSTALHHARLSSHPATWAVGFVLLICVMLAAGVAGSESVDVYLRAGLIFWMIYYAAAHWREWKKNSISNLRSLGWLQIASKLAQLAGVVLLSLGIGALIASDANHWFLIKFMGLVYTVLWLTIAIATKIRR